MTDRARDEDLKNSRLQTLQSVRNSYVQVQLAIEELQDVKASLDLTRAQGHDVMTRFRAGAASRLDVVTSERSVLNYEQQFVQRQATLASNLRDLFALLGETNAPGDLSHPAPPGVEDASLIVKFDSLKKLLEDEASAENVTLDFGHQPHVQSLVYQSDSLEYSAASQKAKVYPSLSFQASAVYMLPFSPLTSGFNQNSATLTLNAPLWLGDPTWHQAGQTLQQAESTRHREEQERINISRDFAKAKELLESLRRQRELATDDIRKSAEAARLYYSSYKSGSSTLLDVQNANTQALEAKVHAARLDAQILTQLITLKALSGEELLR
jgi:outer membrane protein TolC